MRDLYLEALMKMGGVVTMMPHTREYRGETLPLLVRVKNPV